MEEFNSDERFLVPDSEDEDLNSREPWDLVSGLEAIASQKRTIQADYEVNDYQVMSSPHKKEREGFPTSDSSESARGSDVKKSALAYDTVSSDIESEESHNQTVIERKILFEKNLMDRGTSTPSEHIGNLNFSQEAILVPETLDSVIDEVGQSPTILHTNPFIIPDSPSQDRGDVDTIGEEQDEISFKPILSSNASQGSMKIDSQGLHLHLSQSQMESSENAVDLEEDEDMPGDKGIVTTPIKDPRMSLSGKKLTLKDAPQSPQVGGSLPRPSFHLPSKLNFPSASEEEEDAESFRLEKQTGVISERSLKKQPKKLRLFMDTEEESKSEKDNFAKEGKSQPQVEASLVLTEEPESMMNVDDHTMSYDYDRSLDQSHEDVTFRKSILRKETLEKVVDVTHIVKQKEESQSQEAEFDGFEEEIEEIKDISVQSDLKDVPGDGNLAGESREDSPNAPSSQVKLTSCTELEVGDAGKDLANENSSVVHAFSEVSTLPESTHLDPYHFQGSQSQNVADVSNQIQSDKSRSVGSKTKVVKIMRKVLKKKIPPSTNQKSSSTDESGSNKPNKPVSLRRKMSAAKNISKKTKPDVHKEKADVTSGKKQNTKSVHEFTTLQSKTSDISTVPIPLSQSSTVSPIVSSEMPPPMTRADLSKRGTQTTIETSPLGQNKLSKKTTTVSFQDDVLPKAKPEAKDFSDYSTGEIERKTVRECKAIVVERETTIEIVDDKGNILKQTVTKEVIRTPVEPPWLAVDVQVTERILSPNVSPSRSVSTLTSGDLADVSSSSLSRSISSGSKGSNPSLEFCSQSYPTPAQRGHPLESGGDEANPLGKAPITTVVSSSVAAKPDSKRLSSGSNTGQDLFGSPDQSLIPLCDSGNFDRPPSSSSSTPLNINNQVILSSVRVATCGEEKNKTDEGTELVKNTKIYEPMCEISERAENVENMDEDSAAEASSEKRNLRGHSNRKKQEGAKDLSSTSKGKRKMEEKCDHENSQPGKRTRQEKTKEIKQKGDVENVEASGSSVSTGFVVNDGPPSEQTSPHEKAPSSKSKETIGEQEALNTSADSLTVDIKSRLLAGEQVMGKWTDGFYYPGVLKKMDTVNLRYYVKFDDGTQRWLGREGLLLAKELPIGQSVMVMRNDGYYECGMIMAYSWASSENDVKGEKFLMYHVERDDGITQKCGRKCLLLSEDQAACLVSNHDLLLAHDALPTTTTKVGDISLDNLVEGKRQHRAKGEKSGDVDSGISGRKPVKTATEEETPSVSHDGGTRSGRKRKIGPVATSTPTPKLTTKAAQAVSTPLKTSTTFTLGGVVSSPSLSRKSPRKTRKGLFGQKLKPPPDLFKGLAFMLTNIEKSDVQRQEEKCLLVDSSLEDTSFDDAIAEEYEVHPFIKDQLQSLILAGGGEVFDKFDIEEIQKIGISKCYLVAAEHQRTVKYLQALAGNVTIVSHQWILHSINQGHLLGLKAFLLPAGISLEKKKLMECKSTCIALRGQTILIVSNRDDFVEAWASILSLAKCHVTTRFPARASKTDPGVDFVVSDTSCSAAIVRKCKNLEIPLVSSEWIAQCLINNSMVNPNSHEKYQHDYGA